MRDLAKGPTNKVNNIILNFINNILISNNINNNHVIKGVEVINLIDETESINDVISDNKYKVSASDPEDEKIQKTKCQ